MEKLTAIKIKNDDGTYSEEIPISVLSENVEWDSTHTLIDVLGSINVDVTGTIQDQISQLFNEKVNSAQLQNYVNNQLNTDVTNWLNTNVNPVGSAVIIDETLTIKGAAADAKQTGDIKNKFVKSINPIYMQTINLADGLIPFYTKQNDRIYIKTIDDSNFSHDQIRFYDKNGTYIQYWSLINAYGKERTFIYNEKLDAYYIAIYRTSGTDEKTYNVLNYNNIYYTFIQEKNDELINFYLSQYPFCGRKFIINPGRAHSST